MISLVFTRRQQDKNHIVRKHAYSDDDENEEPIFPKKGKVKSNTVKLEFPSSEEEDRIEKPYVLN